MPLVRAVIEFVLGRVIRAVQDWLDARKQAAAEKKQSEDYKAVVGKPDATREERKDAEGGFLNGGS